MGLGAIITFIAIYRSYLAWRILRRPIYRRHAIWTALIGAMISTLSIPAAYGELTGSSVLAGISGSPGLTSPYSSTLELTLTYILTVAIFLIVFWAWIDQSIEVAFDMDFLHRDTLLWKGGGRWASWVIIVGWDVGGLFIPQNGQLISMVYYVLFAFIIAYAAFVLFLSSTRVRDEALKSYVKWVGVMAASLVVLTFTYPYYAPAIVFAYALYRASGSFTMTSPLEASEARA